MKVSIAMATYNGAKYLRQQLDSFVAQLQLPTELVICDDASTDSTVVIVERFKERAPFEVTLIQNEKNVGHVKSFEKALMGCSGDIIFLSDQDDIWLPEKIDKMVRVASQKKDFFVFCCDMMITDESLNNSGFTQLENIIKHGFSLDEFGPGCSMMIRQEWLELILPIPIEMPGHDSWINKMSTALGTKQIIYDRLQLYRRHGSSTSSSPTSDAKRNSAWSLVARYGLRDASAYWMRQSLGFEQISKRISDSEESLKNMGFAERIEPALSYLKRQVDVRDKRIAIAKASPIFRALPIFKLWRYGGYNYFCGWKSAIKDLFRQKARFEAL